MPPDVSADLPAHECGIPLRRGEQYRQQFPLGMTSVEISLALLHYRIHVALGLGNGDPVLPGPAPITQQYNRLGLGQTRFSRPLLHLGQGHPPGQMIRPGRQPDEEVKKDAVG